MWLLEGHDLFCKDRRGSFGCQYGVLTLGLTTKLSSEKRSTAATQTVDEQIRPGTDYRSISEADAREGRSRHWPAVFGLIFPRAQVPTISG